VQGGCTEGQDWKSASCIDGRACDGAMCVGRGAADCASVVLFVYLHFRLCIHQGNQRIILVIVHIDPIFAQNICHIPAESSNPS
jgi:hypothetical protein